MAHYTAKLKLANRSTCYTSCVPPCLHTVLQLLLFFFEEIGGKQNMAITH